MTQNHVKAAVSDIRRNVPPSGSADSGEDTTKRPRFSPRTSSLHLPTKFSASNTSLNPHRSLPSSGLKREVLPTPGPGSPQDVLRTILGQDRSGMADSEGSVCRIPQRPSTLIAEISFGNRSLTAFARQHEGRANHTLSYTDDSSAMVGDQYQMRIGDFERLRESVGACNDVLESVENSLSGFQTDLGNVSSEIESLQTRSTSINTKLQRRRSVETRLGPAVENLSIPPRTVIHLSEGTIDDAWIAALRDLDKRLAQLEDVVHHMAAQEAAMDLRPLIESLRDRVGRPHWTPKAFAQIWQAIERARDYLVAQIRALRSPNLNAQIIQQRALIRHKDLFLFLAKHHPLLADDIRQAYSNTMRWYYEANFSRYKQALERLTLFDFGKQDALGNDSSSARGAAHSANSASRAPNPWSIGHRAGILTTSKNAALSAQVAQNMNGSCYIETPFHAFTIAIAENASAEYAFLTAFLAGSTTPSIISKTFHGIFAPTFNLGFELTKSLINETVDCVGLLLCVRITQQQAFVLQRKKCPVTESWTNGTNMLLWPRFQGSMDVHIESVRLSASTASPSLMTGRSDDNRGNVAPHPVTQRFGQLLQSLLTLSNRDGLDIGPESISDGGPAIVGSDLEPVSRSLQRLRHEMENLLLHLSKSLGQIKRARFLANNYSLILTIIADSGGNLAHEQREWFASKMNETGLE